jgi:transposase
MANHYSVDLRKKVLAAIDGGMNKHMASRVFGISHNTIYQWLKRRAATGDICPKAYRPSGGEQKITDLAAFRVFVDEHSDKTQAEMAALWGGVSQRTISRYLYKLGYSRKKHLWLQPEK